MLMKFLSNSPITHIAANTHPAVPLPAVVTITCNHNFAVNKWNHSAGRVGWGMAGRVGWGMAGRVGWGMESKAGRVGHGEQGR